ncbi:PLP-dependent aminotransferase family protein [Frisingicoccus sp.]|uniref:MocR-like pyridoxine biosynthesis transcription factor PdxR n=1 Tax=Frisingicoccus sp. TaxID=1918627 RepID=UPI003AB8C390
MLTYSFVDLGSDSLYEYLYKCIKNDIMNGKLKSGDKLPSKRSFAKNLDISTITVENAYAQLMAEGYIYSLPKRGYFVSEVKTFSEKQPEKVRRLPEKPREESCFADFISNRTSHANFPFSIWAKLTREVLSGEDSTLLLPPPAGGIMELRKAIADHLYQFRGIGVSPEQIIIGAGTEYLYGLLIQLFGNKAVYAIEDPGYQKIAQIYTSHGVDLCYIPMDENGVCTGVLEASGADILHLSPSHHFPTGRVTPISRRYELLGWASKSDRRYIIEDDYDSEFRLLGRPIPALQSIDVMDKVIYMNTFSKSLSSTIRISYMVLPQKLLKEFYEKLGFYSCTVSNFEQYTLARFISGGYFEKHINRMRNYYRNQRDILLESIRKSPLAGQIKIKEENSGLHFLMELQTEMPDTLLEEKAGRMGLRISCLSRYYHRPEQAKQHVIVLNYSGIDREKMGEAIEILERCVNGND